jgi:Zn-dependent M28 family amino/carboxypeptidase
LAVAVAAATAAAGTALLAPTASASTAQKNPTAEQASASVFRKAVTVDGIVEHLRALQAIGDAHADTRAAGSPGYRSSTDYIVSRLRAAGYDVQLDEFDFVYNADAAPPVLNAGGTSLSDQAISMTFSPNGDVTAPLRPIATGSGAAGCAAADFAGLTAPFVALIQRGTCPFAQKVANADAAGAVGVVVYNNLANTALNGTLGAPQTHNSPAVGVTMELGKSLVAQAGQLTRVKVDRVNETRTTYNVLADLKPARGADDVIVVGAHLDSVPAGPGINDNGSGSAGILEMAEELAKGTGRLQNTVRFAWWSAEEFGLLGSKAYVEELKTQRPAELKRIKMNLNFDMIGSPNYGRFIYDGDNTAFKVGPAAAAGPKGSGEIERVFQDAFRDMGLASAATPFSGRSDYGPFIAEGIPAGGLFTGAEGVKTAAQAAVFGGVAGQAYDPCYHQLCDNLTGEDRGARNYDGFGRLLGNINLTGLDEMSDAAATAVYTLARRDLGKQPLVDPAPRMEDVDGINEGGGLHADHDDHEPVAS